MELYRESHANLNISAEVTVLTYQYTGDDPIEVIARVSLGDLAKPIAGGGNYTLCWYINGVLITPNKENAVGPGVTRTIMISREIPIETNDTIVLTAKGLPADTSVNTVASLRNVTPITKEEVTGDGSVMVDQDYGGADALSYKTGAGAGVANATIVVYLTSDYNAGNRSNAFIVAKTSTVVGGKWAFALKLDPNAYTLIYYKTGEYGPDKKEITVS
jgi:hypothetical protein